MSCGGLWARTSDIEITGPTLNLHRHTSRQIGTYMSITCHFCFYAYFLKSTQRQTHLTTFTVTLPQTIIIVLLPHPIWNVPIVLTYYVMILTGTHTVERTVLWTIETTA